MFTSLVFGNFVEEKTHLVDMVRIKIWKKKWNKICRIPGEQTALVVAVRSAVDSNEFWNAHYLCHLSLSLSLTISLFLSLFIQYIILEHDSTCIIVIASVHSETRIRDDLYEIQTFLKFKKRYINNLILLTNFLLTLPPPRKIKNYLKKLH